MQQAAVLDGEQEQAAVDEAQQLLMQVHRGQPVLGKIAAQAIVGGVADEALAEGDQGGGDAIAQLIAGALAGLLRLPPPAFQDRGGRQAAVAQGEPAGVRQQPEGGEIGIEAVLEGALQVDLDVGRAGQARVVAEDAEHEAVGNEAPQRVVVGVEEFLDEAERRAPAAFFAESIMRLVEVEGRRAEHHRHGTVAAAMGEWKAALAQIDRLGALDREAEHLAEKRHQPAVDGGRSHCGDALAHGAEVRPKVGGDAPEAADLVADVEGFGQAVGGVVLVARVEGGDPAEEIGRQQAAGDLQRGKAQVGGLHRPTLAPGRAR